MESRGGTDRWPIGITKTAKIKKKWIELIPFWSAVWTVKWETWPRYRAMTRADGAFRIYKEWKVFIENGRRRLEIWTLSKFIYTKESLWKMWMSSQSPSRLAELWWLLAGSTDGNPAVKLKLCALRVPQCVKGKVWEHRRLTRINERLCPRLLH